MRTIDRGAEFKTLRIFGSALLLVLTSGWLAFADGIPLGDAANFAILYEGGGTGNQLSTTNVTINGNIGIGDPTGSTMDFLAASGGTPAAINGNVYYAGAVSSKNSIQNTTFTGTVTGGNANVQADLDALNALSSNLGGSAGTSVTINTGGSGGSQTLNESDGTLHLLNGTFYRVFTVSSMQFNNQTTLNIVGDGSGDPVVLNFSSNAQFGGAINLEGGLTPDQVLYNITGGSNLTGGNTLQANSNGAVLEGDFLDPNGSISVTHSVVDGRIFGGDSSNMQIVSGDTITAPAVTTPEPSSLLLLGTGLISLLGIGAWRKRLAWSSASFRS